MTIAFACYLVAAFVAVAAGVRYLTRREFMPYHRAAVGSDWQQLSPGMRVLLLGLLRGIGAGFLTLAVAVFVLLAYPFRTGDAWAYWAIPLLGLLLGIPILHGVYAVRARTPGRPPWVLAALTVGLFATGAVFSLVSLIT